MLTLAAALYGLAALAHGAWAHRTGNSLKLSPLDDLSLVGASLGVLLAFGSTPLRPSAFGIFRRTVGGLDHQCTRGGGLGAAAAACQAGPEPGGVVPRGLGSGARGAAVRYGSAEGRHRSVAAGAARGADAGPGRDLRAPGPRPPEGRARSRSAGSSRQVDAGDHSLAPGGDRAARCSRTGSPARRSWRASWPCCRSSAWIPTPSDAERPRVLLASGLLVGTLLLAFFTARLRGLAPARLGGGAGRHGWAHRAHRRPQPRGASVASGRLCLEAAAHWRRALGTWPSWRGASGHGLPGSWRTSLRAASTTSCRMPVWRRWAWSS